MEPPRPGSPTRRTTLLARKTSSTLAEERDAVAQQVEEEAQVSQLLRRKHSAYLPSGADKGESDHLRIAKRAIFTIYTIHRQYERRRAVDNASFLLAMIGIILVFVDNEYARTRAAKDAVRYVNVFLTAILLGLVIWRFTLERAILIQRNVLPPHVSVLRMPRHVLALLIELIVCAICVPPGVHGTFRVLEWKYYLHSGQTHEDCTDAFIAQGDGCYMAYAYPYEVLGLFMLLRLYMIPRVILNLSGFANYRTSYLGTLHHVDTLSSLFVVKCFLRANPFKMLAVAFSGTLVLVSYALAIVEAPVNPSLAPLSNAMWLVVLTMGTVGYGDVTATTFVGQALLIGGGMFMGILLFGVLSAAIFGFLALNDRDRRFVYLLRRQEYNKRLKDACARSIQAAWRCSHARTMGLLTRQPRAYAKLNQRLFARISTQRSLRKQSMDEYKSVATELQRVQDQVLLSLKDEHLTTMKRLSAIEKRLDTLLAATGDTLRSSSTTS